MDTRKTMTHRAIALATALAAGALPLAGAPDPTNRSRARQARGYRIAVGTKRARIRLVCFNGCHRLRRRSEKRLTG